MENTRAGLRIIFAEIRVDRHRCSGALTQKHRSAAATSCETQRRGRLNRTAAPSSHEGLPRRCVRGGWSIIPESRLPSTYPARVSSSCLLLAPALPPPPLHLHSPPPPPLPSLCPGHCCWLHDDPVHQAQRCGLCLLVHILRAGRPRGAGTLLRARAGPAVARVELLFCRRAGWSARVQHVQPPRRGARADQ